MKFIDFLTSRGFAVFLLCVSIGFLILWNTYPDLYSPLFLVAPALVFLSTSFCTLKRVFAGATKRDVGFWGSFVFHIGLLMVIVATSLGPLTRFWATVALPQGMTVNMEDGQFATVHSTPTFAEIPFISLRLDWQENRYEDGRFPVDYAAGLSIGLMDVGVYRQTKETIRVNSPIRKEGYQFLLTHGSLSPLFVLIDRERKVVFNRFVNVSNATDQEDSFEIPEAGLTVYTRFFPDMFKEGDNYGTRSRELKNPAFGIKVTTKKDPFRDTWRGVLKKGERAEFNGMTLEFTDLKPVIIIQVAKDPTYYGIYAGWALIVMGLLVRYSPVFVQEKGVKNSEEEVREVLKV
ncbi:MAG: cytochrome c biogenesis protein ResB [Planctomycetota bacterium]|jgi:cytochrome c biogenesis protein ResB